MLRFEAGGCRSQAVFQWADKSHDCFAICNDRCARWLASSSTPALGRPAHVVMAMPARLLGASAVCSGHASRWDRSMACWRARSGRSSSKRSTPRCQRRVAIAGSCCSIAHSASSSWVCCARRSRWAAPNVCHVSLLRAGRCLDVSSQPIRRQLQHLIALGRPAIAPPPPPAAAACRLPSLRLPSAAFQLCHPCC